MLIGSAEDGLSILAPLICHQRTQTIESNIATGHTINPHLQL
jgi:hypothetical protein